MGGGVCFSCESTGLREGLLVVGTFGSLGRVVMVSVMTGAVVVEVVTTARRYVCIQAQYTWLIEEGKAIHLP